MDVDITKIKKVFFVGIGGIGISAIARMMLIEGKEVLGSDMSEGEVTHELKDLGIPISVGQGFDLIPADTDLIVYTIAIKHYDPALMDQIFASGILAKSYPEMLHIVTGGKYTIAVSGTHGKTTTTAMIAKILIEAKKDPSVIVGSLLKEYKSNLIVGGGEHFVVEACEYERSFLNIEPKVLVITNIEADHLDYYKDLADIENAFTEMSTQTANAIVCDPTDASVMRVLQQLPSDKKIAIVDYTKYFDKVPHLAVPGEHNRKDAAAALAVADFIGIDGVVASVGAAQFTGTWRRLEMKGVTKNGTIVYDDYAHHPTEVKASLEALRELYPHGSKKIIVVFQPHLYSRTKALFAEFTTAFNEADAVYFLPIYFAREAPDPTISSEILAEAVAKNVPGARAFIDLKEAEEFFAQENPGSDTVLVTMGAGEAYKVGDILLLIN
jgi:UDP-N-acetylmuramate--alanine ligase